MCKLNCPYCASSTKVTNSRSRAKGSQVWRRRECKKCSAIWTTHEVIDLSTSHRVVYADSSIQPFSRDLLFISIKTSLQHRNTALEDATYLTDNVLAKVLALKTAKIKTDKLVDVVHHILTNYDKTAAAVYRASHS